MSPVDANREGRQDSLKARMRGGEILLGTFLKTPAPHLVEIMGHSGLDFAIVDQEHAPIGLEALDLIALAGRAVDLPLLTRHFGKDMDWIAPVLDLGMTGVMVPHVLDGATVASIFQAALFQYRKRGLSPSPRAGDYGKIGLAGYPSKSDARTVVAVQIEDVEAFPHLDEIVSQDEIDLVFIGPTDLAQSLDAKPASDELNAAIQMIIDACRAQAKAIGIFVSAPEQMHPWAEKGVTVFVCGSDQSFLKSSLQALTSRRSEF